MRRTFVSHLLPALIAASGGLVPAALPQAAEAARAVVLMLPEKATIETTQGQSYSPVRLSAFNGSRITYEKGGKRSLPAASVKSIAFLGNMILKAKGDIQVRGVKPRGCAPASEEVQVAATALTIQADGTSLALLPAQLPEAVRKDLLQASQVRTLVVNELRFDPGGKVRVVFRSCAREE